MMANDPGVVVAAARAFELSSADLGAAGRANEQRKPLEWR